MADRPVCFSTTDQSECQHCGAHVSRDFRRTFGDEENVAHRCPACDSMGRICRGTAAGKELDYPDPEDQPQRNQGGRVDARPDGGESL
ncbi:DUF7563 family protein [Halomicrobium mukohataei]|uniref:Small CPxCG-related zinc finger protein n=1 Tax=Halomicrobium mukohataei TaxID=57705 RepID=A0A4D6KE40_9EURY|nr:hypothetical protein E5139_05590 [Halomicrobium mukohataei]QFR19945.1 hypothetical protein GBQ70_05585 [Halomicrobium sp. ZPS1]